MIWLIGNRGMLGSALERMFQDLDIAYSATDIEIDITSAEKLREYGISIFNKNQQHWIVNCSAYTAVDKAEDEPEIALKINSEGVENIARCAREFNAKLIHISTDYVFDGTNPSPLTEKMEANPVSVYGRTKFEGENSLKAITNSYFIIRTAWLYGLYGSNFIYTMLKLMEDHDSISVVNDQNGSPTNAEDLSVLIVDIIKQNSKEYGTYHYSNEGEISWYDFANEIYRLGHKTGILHSNCTVTPCGSNKFPTKAKRPKYSLLSKEKVKIVLKAKVPDWQDSLNNFFLKFNQINSRVLNWIEHSDYDFETAIAMNSSGRFLYVLITAQQSIEKQMKAIYEYRGGRIPRIHDLLRLASGLDISLERHQVKLLTDLSYYYTASRYSERIKSLSLDIDKNVSKNITEMTKEMLLWLKSMIPFV